MSINAICKRLKEARIKRGFSSARNFALHQNIPDSTYTQHESGKRQISIGTLIYYSNLLDVSSAWLLTGKQNIQSKKHYPILKLPTKLIDTDKEVLEESIQINLELLSKIIFKSFLQYNNNNINYETLVSTCYKIYNSIINTVPDSLQDEYIDKSIANAINTISTTANIE